MNYENKDSSYYSNVRKDLVNLITQPSGLAVMEIGAAYGETLFYLKEIGVAKEAVGIDLFEDSNKSNYKKVDHFIFGNVDQLQLPQYNNHFDLILLPDVLEHIDEPKKTLIKIKEYLKNDGEIIVSMPNIRHYSAFMKIFVKGDFKYEESGIFDYTHVRFYCKKNIQELLESAGYKIIRSEGSIRNFKGRSVAKIVNQITFGIFEEFLSTQYFFKIKKV
jgi:2-polyprenyl-3-methyl-5-hydroxy-6-metoxy-1,4-benzoquinol methylase